jgi:hypothetical protein
MAYCSRKGEKENGRWTKRAKDAKEGQCTMQQSTKKNQKKRKTKRR